MTPSTPLTRRRLAMLGFAAVSGSAAPALSRADVAVLRIGSVVPKNSLYHRQLLEMGQAWRTAQGVEARFAVFTDGAQGGEAELVRRMHIGQLQGALMSVTGLHDIEPSISALQSLPLLFRNWEEVDHVRERIRPTMEKRFLERGFVVLCWGDAGWVRFFSKTPAMLPADYKGRRFFAWGSEPQQQAIMKSLGYIPVPLETTDILPAVQTGMIDVLPSTPYFALASQVYATASHMLEINWAPIVGALVVTRRAWEAMSPAGQQALKQAGELAGQQMRAQARLEVTEAASAMEKRGLTIHRPTREQMGEWYALAEQLYPRLRGTLVPAEAFDEVFATLKAYRTSKGQ
jgi:TRAP-type transport system periplasmic protein